MMVPVHIRFLFDPCKTPGQGIDNLLFAFFPMLLIPAHQLRPTWWRNDWTMARANGVVGIVQQQVEGFHIAEEIAYR